jgi:hypothetical protein
MSALASWLPPQRSWLVRTDRLAPFYLGRAAHFGRSRSVSRAIAFRLRTRAISAGPDLQSFSAAERIHQSFTGQRNQPPRRPEAFRLHRLSTIVTWSSWHCRRTAPRLGFRSSPACSNVSAQPPLRLERTRSSGLASWRSRRRSLGVCACGRASFVLHFEVCFLLRPSRRWDTVTSEAGEQQLNSGWSSAGFECSRGSPYQSCRFTSGVSANAPAAIICNDICRRR